MKKSPAKMSRKGRTRVSASCRNSESTIRSPARNAPKANERPSRPET
jgi:hypothetical protein